MKKRNLLFLFTDEQRADTMACYGNTKIDTPNLNRLAEESVAFEKCYVTQPVCTPSRSTILTGLYPHTSGCTHNNVPLRDETPCLPEMLPSCRTGYFGKWHLGDEIYAQHGFEQWISIEDGYRRYYREGRNRDDRSTFHHWLVEKGYTPQDGKADGPAVFGRGTVAGFPEEHSKPAYLAEETSNWLRGCRQDEPFIGFVNFLEPHMPFTGPRDEQYPLDYVDLPANYENVPDERNHLKQRMLHNIYREQGFGGVALGSEQGWRRLTANYWGLVSEVDAAVGAILQTLRECGLEEDTIIVFTSDHGDMMGSHQLLAKTVMMEEAVTVPCLIKAPGVKPRMERQIISQVDLVPTLLDLMGSEAPGSLEGQSLRPLIEHGAPPEQRDVFIEWSGSDSGISKLEQGEPIPEWLSELGPPERLVAAIQDPLRTVVTEDRWKLNYSPHLEQHELYDLNSDPYEKVNLYELPEHRDRVEDMKERIRAWGRATDDEIASSI